jgi:hypothetical protein
MYRYCMVPFSSGTKGIIFADSIRKSELCGGSGPLWNALHYDSVRHVYVSAPTRGLCDTVLCMEYKYVLYMRDATGVGLSAIGITLFKGFVSCMMDGYDT